MAVWLYRDGGKDLVRGVYCDAELFPAELVGSALQGEWRITPEDPEIPKDKPEDCIHDLLEKSSNEDIREIAEGEGIENFATARIETLKKELIKKDADGNSNEG